MIVGAGLTIRSVTPLLVTVGVAPPPQKVAAKDKITLWAGVIRTGGAANRRE